MKTFLEVKNLSVHFKNQIAIDNISFKMSEAQSLGFAGESGSGKSLTALSLIDLLPVTSKRRVETLTFMGKNLENLKQKEWRKIRGKEIAMIFQDPSNALDPSFSIGYQMIEALKLHYPKYSKEQYQNLAYDLLSQVGIREAQEKILAYPHQLSGGMCQRVMIAIAICGNPSLLIADEPTTALDVTIQKQILNLLKELQEKNKMALILISHDLSVLSHYTDTLQIMYKGKLLESGPTEKILSHPSHTYTQNLLTSIPKKDTPFRQPFDLSYEFTDD